MNLRGKLALTLLAFLAAPWIAQARADGDLRVAYGAILRGDYESGEAALRRVSDSDQARRVHDWLASFRDTTQGRDALRSNMLAWNAEHAQQALKDDKTYLALSFTAQGAPYAPTRQEYANEPWVRDLLAKALAEAEQQMTVEHWTQALSYATLIRRVDEDHARAKEISEAAVRHARLEALYGKDDDVKRRLEGVTEELLTRSVALINESYYEAPDFRKMADGALDGIDALCTTPKLYDGPDAFDGMANAASRALFQKKLARLRAQVEGEKSFDHNDLIRLFKEIKRASADSVELPERLLIVEFLSGALNKLDDFTSVVWPADSEEFDKYMVGNFFGVGIQLGVDELTSRLMVVTPLENSPALAAGIQPDDLIVAVDGESTADWDTDKAIQEITGPEGTMVKLTIFRPRTGQEIPFPLRRSRIQLATIRGVSRLDSEGKRWNYMLDPQAGVAYIRLTGFNPESGDELKSALADARSQGMRGLIMDLRGNPGGLLDVAIDVVSLFQRKGDIVWTKGRAEARQHHEAEDDAPFADLPLVVLVNEGSASASEIFAGALQDHGRAVVLGERTFGKGSVQRVLRLDPRFSLIRNEPSARLKLTTALYYLPSNRSPHRLPDAETWGVEPDSRVELTPKEFGKLLELQRKAYIISNHAQEDDAALDDAEKQARAEKYKVNATAEGDDEEEQVGPLLTESDIKELRSAPFEAPESDPQLETALLQLRVKLAANLPWPEKLAKGQAPKAANP